jgi:hypothetical protein
LDGSAKHLLQQLNCPPDQVRGIGLSMTRLQGKGGGGEGPSDAAPLERFFQQQVEADGG